MPEPIRRDISKEEAARRQIDTAIRMLFSDEDAICVHVLVQSAATIVRDVCRKNGIEAASDQWMAVIKPEARASVRKKTVDAYNYFKHADTDHSKTLSFFNEETTDLLLLEAIYDYLNAFKKITPSMQTFFAWMIALNPDCFEMEDPVGFVAIENAGPLRNSSREEQKKVGLLRDRLRKRIPLQLCS